MSVKLPCGCKDTVMCKVHEAAWWERHVEALKRQADAQGYTLAAKYQSAPPPDNSDLL